MIPKNGMTFLLIFSIFFQFQNIDAQQNDSIKTTRFLQSIRDTFPEIPGIYAIAVDRERILFTASAGYADSENKKTFNMQTELYVASNTKAFIGLALAQLSANGSLSYDDPIVDYLDADRFPDSLNIDEITIRNLLGHTHGYSNDVITFRTAFAGNAPDSVLPGLLRFTSWYGEPGNHDFRYNNFSYLLAGMVIEQVTGSSWQKYLKDSLLIPAGLKQTTPFISDLDPATLAKPYIYSPSGNICGKVKSENTMHAAGGLMSTATDMGRWLRLFIDNGNSALSSEIISWAIRPLVADTGRMGPFMRYGYASGWITGNYNGDKMLFHFGSYPGYGSMMSFMPEKDLGVFVFVNEGKTGMMVSAMALTYIYDLLLNKNHNPQTQAMIKNMVIKTLGKQTDPPSRILSPGDAPVKEKVCFNSEKYGDLWIYPEGDQVHAKLGNLIGTLYHSDTIATYLVDWIPGSPEILTFEKDSSGIRVVYKDYGIFIQAIGE